MIIQYQNKSSQRSTYHIKKTVHIHDKNMASTTNLIKSIKSNQPSSPRDFFQRIYGDLEKNTSDKIAVKREDSGNEEVFEIKSNTNELIAPIPILAAPIPFILPASVGNESHIAAAAAAGLSAFCKFYL